MLDQPPNDWVDMYAAGCLIVAVYGVVAVVALIKIIYGNLIRHYKGRVS